MNSKKENKYKCIKCNKEYNDYQFKTRDKKLGHLKPLIYGYRNCNGKVVKA